MSDTTRPVTVRVRVELPGLIRSVETTWPVSDEPRPHKVMVAHILRELADEIERDDEDD